jgi:predicted PurR-regulated permease PerM
VKVLESTTNRTEDLARIVLQLLALGLLIAASLWIVRPFVIATVWAATVVIATWPILLRAQSWLGGRRSLAVTLMTVLLLLILVVPLYFAVSAIVENIGEITNWSKSVATLSLSEPPKWVASVPVVGSRIATRWKELAAAGPEHVSEYLSPLAKRLALWLLQQVGNLGLLLIQFLLTVIIAAILYANGEKAAQGVGAFLHKLIGEQGAKAVHLAVQAVRSVAYGIVVTAILQAALAGVGLALVGVPFAMLLTALIFILAIAQIGAWPVLIGAVVWTYSRDGALWGTGFLLWSIFCGTFDNILRPVLIKRGADLPLLLIFAGVIGGLIAFGVIGLFIGPVVLAVAYTLLADWVTEDQMVPSPTDSDGTA